LRSFLATPPANFSQPFGLSLHCSSLNKFGAIGEAMDDVREGRTYNAEEFMAKVEQRWPGQGSA